ncbi:MAG: UTP--glucose-1-phosphate uridylyltransferase, partial [Lachnospiraceae bacterium]|nr:UTP--glucose-1-phosphate uridylyltransferase [Lachnospiraceae bacterium]
MTLEQAREKCVKYGQEHVLRYYDQLTDPEREVLLSQIEATDMTILASCKNREALAKKGVITPLKCMEHPEIEAGKEAFRKTGLEAIRAGKVAAVLLAGGMGTRLGSDAPKGVYNIGITRELYIFECLIRNLTDVTREAGCPI